MTIYSRALESSGHVPTDDGTVRCRPLCMAEASLGAVGRLWRGTHRRQNGASGSSCVNAFIRSK
jgi:hypothetical protein